MLFLSCVCHALVSVHCCWGRADLLALVYDVLLCSCHCPMWFWYLIVSIHGATGLSAVCDCGIS